MHRELLRTARRRRPALAPSGALLAALLAGCSGGGGGDGTSAGFALSGATANAVLVEGDDGGLTLPLGVTRSAGATAPITLRLEAASEADVAAVTHAFDDTTLDAGESEARLTLRLDIADRSILPGSRRFFVVASDGTYQTRTAIDVAVEPVDAPDVYLLIGQSNMVGSSGDGTRDASPGGPDEPDPRVRQLNVTANDPSGPFATAAAYTSPEANVVGDPIVLAEDPLHVPRSVDRPSGKGFEYIGLGLTFGKRALADTSREVVLVPAAWSGSAFCDNDNGPVGQWNARPTPDTPVLGNTLLFDRALLRVDTALAASGGILRGILWHQGESDSNTPCAALYAENLARLARELRTRIAPDRRGPALRGPDAPIPFVVGTMSRGVDAKGDYSYESYNSAKRVVDAVHRDVAALIPHSAVSVHDDLTPANGYPCGYGDCIHFGARALREMGVRYHAALDRALGAGGTAAAGPDGPSGALVTADAPDAP